MIKEKIVILLSVLLLVSMFAMPAVAQDQNLEMSTPEVGTVVPGTIGTDEMLAPTPYGSGTARSATWYAASKFTVRLSSTSPVLTYSSYHFYNAPGMSSPTRYYAQLDLEPGVVVDMIVPVYNDSSGTNNVYVALQRYLTDICSGVQVSNDTLASVTSSGSPGIKYDNVALSANETINSLTGGGCTLSNYYLAADIASDTSLAGVYVFWTRQISPAPGTATFSDVPTTHPFFQEIEALAASGITTGYGDGTFRPTNYVTRQAMAAFLSRALGLHWEY